MNYIKSTSFTKTDNIPIIDVRSPKEYDKGHISGAVNVPLFSNDEHHLIGLTYKQIGKIEAIEKGLEFVGVKMNALAQQAKILNANPLRKVYCWRGGMRSEKTSWLFELLGMECQILDGGYKAYRNQQIEDFLSIKNLVVLHGSTGAGKTEILYELKKLGEQILDLEGLANHRGSVFGHLGNPPQPTSQQPR